MAGHANWLFVALEVLWFMVFHDIANVRSLSLADVP